MPTLTGLKRRLRQTIKPSPVDHFMREVHGWTSYEQLEFLTQQVRSLPDNSVIVEVGVWHGRSALAMAEACRGTSKHVYAIDPWQNYSAEVDGAGYDGEGIIRNSGLDSFDDVLETFKSHIQAFSLTRYVTPMRTTGVDAASHWTERADFVFIDANHAFEGVFGDVTAWAPLAPTICGDDWDFTGGGTDRSVERAVRTFLSDNAKWQLTLPAPNTWMIKR